MTRAVGGPRPRRHAIQYNRGDLLVDLLLRTRRLHFPPRSLGVGQWGDRWPLSFWRGHGWLRVTRRTRRDRLLAKRRAAMRAAIRRGTMAMRDAKPDADARLRELHDAYEAGVILREAEPGSLDAFLDAGACCAGADE